MTAKRKPPRLRRNSSLMRKSAEAFIEKVGRHPCIVIRVPVANVPQALRGARDIRAIDLPYKVTDAAVFAKEMVREMNREDEEGTTAIHRMLDDAMSEAIEQGAEGVEEDPDDDNV